MDKMAMYAFLAGTLSTFLALIAYVFYAISGVRAARMATAGAPMTTGRVGFVSGPRTASIGHYATLLGWLGFALIGASLVFRAIATGHGPFSNMYEFSIAFAWGILGAYYWFEHKYHQRMLGLLAGAVVGGIIGGIARWSGVGAALADSEGGRWGLPKPQVLDEIGYRAVVVGFPFLTLTILLGAVWAETAWGSYWSWDPKETASLVTWLIYGAFLHARVMRGWRGDRAAWLLVIGFVATLFTYFGNYVFGGLHSYAGLG
jgi:ABC-type transport system involved in cytochrome c biogenesis permease subunit